jgi:hypothetical protein
LYLSQSKNWFRILAKFRTQKRRCCVHGSLISKLQYSVFGEWGGGRRGILCYSQSGDNPQEDLAKFDS